ncbi:hypothetical protein J3R83DRAFT_5115 [Lanmaoa asiatica]|nr:hypothetical protein J3R83DRAFT_5115 [Lanmaoa asiatica]
MEPVKRLSSEAEGKAWLDTIVGAYALRSGVSLSSGRSGGSGDGGAGGATINSEESLLKFKAEQDCFAAQRIELCMCLNRDSCADEIAHDKEKAMSAQLQARLDSIAREHGDTYIDGIQPTFDPLKLKSPSLRLVLELELTAHRIALLNRADPKLLTYMQYHIDRCNPNKGDTYALAKQFGQQLIDNTREVLGQPPVYEDVTFPTAPHTEVTAKGDIVYTELIRENVCKLEAYVEEMASGSSRRRSQTMDCREIAAWN